MEMWKDRLAALVPCYDRAGGNATRIYTITGEAVEDQRTVRWNLRRLARLYCVDLESARSIHGQYLDRRQGVPLPFSAALVLVPLKVREPVGKNDGTCGYFSPAAVREVLDYPEGKARSALLLTGGHRVLCYYGPRTVCKRLQDGNIILERFRREVLSGGAQSPGAAVALPPEYRYFLERLVMAMLNGSREESS